MESICCIKPSVKKSDRVRQVLAVHSSTTCRGCFFSFFIKDIMLAWSRNRMAICFWMFLSLNKPWEMHLDFLTDSSINIVLCWGWIEGCQEISGLHGLPIHGQSQIHRHLENASTKGLWNLWGFLLWGWSLCYIQLPRGTWWLNILLSKVQKREVVQLLPVFDLIILIILKYSTHQRHPKWTETPFRGSACSSSHPVASWFTVFL